MSERACTQAELDQMRDSITLTLEKMRDLTHGFRPPLRRIRIAPGQWRAFTEALGLDPDAKDPPPRGVRSLYGVEIAEDAYYVPPGMALLIDSEGQLMENGVVFFRRPAASLGARVSGGRSHQPRHR